MRGNSICRLAQTTKGKRFDLKPSNLDKENLQAQSTLNEEYNMNATFYLKTFTKLLIAASQLTAQIPVIVKNSSPPPTVGRLSADR